jgi:aconitate hydratase
MDGIRRTLKVAGREYAYYSLPHAADILDVDLERLPCSLKILLENLLRNLDGGSVSVEDVRALAEWAQAGTSGREICFSPSRVLMQDFTGVPAVVDLAAMRDAVVALGGNPDRVNPRIPVDLVIDHSVQVDRYGCPEALASNSRLEMQRNRERYEFLRWAQSAFSNFRVVPPGIGICHQVNLECLATVVSVLEGARPLACPDTLVGTDSHTPMVGGIGVLGWGVGGIEAEAAMLGQVISMQIPGVVGVRLSGELCEGVTTTDLVLTVTRKLRDMGVVGKFVEYCGPGLSKLQATDRATIANMAPEYGATCGFFPLDEQTTEYLRLTGRSAEQVDLVEAYARAQGMWRTADAPEPLFDDVLEIDLATIAACMAGPKRPQDMIELADAAAEFRGQLDLIEAPGGGKPVVEGSDFSLTAGDIVIAAITSCTNTSNPAVMIAAGLVARKARSRGLATKPWVKTSLAPGSQVVARYLDVTGLQQDLDELGFNLVGYGCTTCIGNSGPLDPAIDKAIRENDLPVTSVLSANRNFEGRVHALVTHNYLMSPPLVVAYALAGTMSIDLCTEPLGQDTDGQDVYLKDIWPTGPEIAALVDESIDAGIFTAAYSGVFEGNEAWRALPLEAGVTYAWRDDSTYIKRPPFFENMPAGPPGFDDLTGARILALLGDSITTDHISPAGSIAEDCPAGEYLRSVGQRKQDFNSYGSRRGNHEVMMRGTLANVRIRNEMVPDATGGCTVHFPGGEFETIYAAALRYAQDDVPLVIVGGKEYGTGSSRDWAAKGTLLLGVKAVIAESFERIHRSNLIGMGVLPLTFAAGTTRKTLGLDGSEVMDLSGLSGGITPGMDVTCRITRGDGHCEQIALHCCLDTGDEVESYRHGGILHKVIRGIVQG